MDNIELEFFAFVAIMVSLFISFLMVKIELNALESQVQNLKASLEKASASRKLKNANFVSAKAKKTTIRKKGKSNG